MLCRVFTKKNNIFYRCYRFAACVVQRFVRENFTYHASALTFTTLLSIVPLTTVILSILSAFPILDPQETAIQDFIFNNLIPASGHEIRQYLLHFASHARKLSFTGMAMLVVTSIMLLLTIENSLNMIWQVKVGRRGLSALLRYFLILSVAPVLIVASVVLTTHLFFFSFVMNAAILWGIKAMVLALLPPLMTFLGLTLLYIAAPNCSVKWRHGMIGAVTAAILFEVAKRGFAWYVVHFSTDPIVYGSFAVIPIFLLWIYLSWAIILFGACISHAVATVNYELI